MGYISNNLLEGENVQYSARLHWIIYLPHIPLLLIGIGFITILFPLVRAYTTEMAATNKRVIAKEGLITRRTLEMNLSKVETIGVHQGVWGRIFGYGTVVVVGTGGTREPFAWISSPLKFRREVQRLSNLLSATT
ncbi:MAG: PH domain-containing protein [Myxococcota bacterium]